MAAALAQPGQRLGLVGRDPERLAKVASVCRRQGAECTVAHLDVRQPTVSTFLQSFDRRHPIDLLVLNAGILDGRRDGEVIEDGPTARSVLEVNLLAPIANLHAMLPAMRERRRGTIVLVASLAAFVPLADAPAYSASKAALVSYGLAVREALGNEGINVVVACPGFVATPMSKVHIGDRPGEVSAESAAQAILDGVRRNRALVGFPVAAHWLSRLALFVPERFRYHRMSKTKFHVAPPLPIRPPHDAP
jgi:short-subunit dehydrogenase